MPTRDGARRWGEPLWPGRHLPKPAQIEPLSADVAIIGGGLTGMSAAFHLARRGLRTVVLEAAVVGEGASGRTGGIVLEGIATGVRPGAEDCVPGLARIVAELCIECDLRLPGCWEIEHREGGARQALPWRDEGAPIRIARTVAGGSVEPRALLMGLAEAASAAGAIVAENCPVRRIDLRRLTVEMEGRVLNAAHLIVALNAWTAAIVPGLPRLHCALTYALATEALTDPVLREIGLETRMPFYTDDTPYLWGRVAAGGEVVFGSGLSFGSPDQLENMGIASGDSPAILERLERRVRGLNPALAKVRIAQRWAGPIAFTEGAVPLLGRHPENPAVLVAGAYAGHGVAFSVHAGAMAARAIADGTQLPRWGALDRRA
ncbi:MAG TPA: FAD-binding oxidoreductase [Candidatus Binataceae bacterium]|nr:FAD-binding oxidoreductase [Candidatus Binataceae bacterium]